MKTISVVGIWEGIYDVEVSDDWEKGMPLPSEAFDQMESHTASLVDWVVQ